MYDSNTGLLKRQSLLETLQSLYVCSDGHPVSRINLSHVSVCVAVVFIKKIVKEDTFKTAEMVLAAWYMLQEFHCQ